MSEYKWTRAHMEAVVRTLVPEGEPGSAKARRRARILRAATELFLQHGYRKTSVEEIAQRAEVAKGTVYLDFDSKATLLVHAIAVEKQVLFETLAPVFDPELDGEARLRFYVRSMLTVARDLPLVASTLRGDREMLRILEEADPRLVEQSQAVGLEWLSDLLEAAAPGVHSAEGRAERAEVLLGLRYFTGLLLEDRVRAGRDLESFADTMADMLVYGLIHPSPPREDP